MLLPVLGGAQNLVQNPGFENYLKLPNKHYNGIGCAQYWRAHNGNGDYYHTKSSWWTGVPGNIFGRQRAHGGLAYAGICIRKKFKEYLEIKLSTPLVSGQTYYIELFVSQAERFSGKVASVGLLFKNHICWSNDNSGISESPAINFVLKDSIRIKKRWIHLTSTYVADGTENVLIIGYFEDGRTPPHKGFSHLYIDDVRIEPLKSAFNLLPNLNVSTRKITSH